MCGAEGVRGQCVGQRGVGDVWGSVGLWGDVGQKGMHYGMDGVQYGIYGVYGVHYGMDGIYGVHYGICGALWDIWGI